MKKISDMTIKKRSKLMLRYFFKRGRQIKIIASINLVISLVVLGVVYSFVENRLAEMLAFMYVASSFIFLILAVLNVFVRILTAEDFDFICKDDYLTGYEKAFYELAIPIADDAYIAKPVEILTPAIFPGRNKIVYRYHKNENEIKYSHSNYEWMFFGHTHFYYFSVCINHIDGSVGFTRGLEVKYDDIIIIETKTSFGVSANQGKKAAVDLLQLKLTFTNGDPLAINIRCQPIMHDERRPNPISEKEEEIISAIRGTIRKSKTA